MQQRKGCGCAAAIAVAVGVVLVFGFGALFKMRSRNWEAIEAPAVQAGPVVFKQGDFPKFPPQRVGEEVSREHFASLMIDNYATELARESFRKTADNAPIKWLLLTEDIRERDGTIRGFFMLPYELRSGNHMNGGSIRLECEFAEEGRDELLRVRRGDWVELEGRLGFRDDQAVIRDARIAGAAATPHAERP